METKFEVKISCTFTANITTFHTSNQTKSLFYLSEYQSTNYFCKFLNKKYGSEQVDIYLYALHLFCP